MKRVIPELIKKSSIFIIFTVIIAALYLLYSLRFRPVLSDNLNAHIGKSFITLFILFLACWFQRICGVAISLYSELAGKTETRWDDEFIPLLKRVTNLVVWTIAIVIILSNFGVNINALIAALGVGSLAIALAAQDTIANIISGFLIMIDRPFRVGDKVKLPSGEKVGVLDIGIRRSKFLAEDGAIIIVPNLELSKQKITNFTYGEERTR